MDQNKPTDLGRIKRHYGEDMMRLCRALFPTILENDGVLFKVIDSSFARSKFLYDDILSNNKIADFEQIDNIASCKSLEKLYLVDNVVTKMKNYRLYVIYKIPTLRILDYQRVTKKEREEAIKKFSQK